MNTESCYATPSRPPLIQRIYRRGRERWADEAYDMPEWAKDCITINTNVRMGMWGRILFLFSGHFSVQTRTYVQHPTYQCLTFAASKILAPGEEL